MRDAMISGWTQRLLSLLPVRTRSNAKLAREEQIAGRPRLPWPLRLFLLPIRTRHPDTSSSSVSHRIHTLGVCEYSFEWNSGRFTTDATESERTNAPSPSASFSSIQSQTSYISIRYKFNGRIHVSAAGVIYIYIFNGEKTRPVAPRNLRIAPRDSIRMPSFTPSSSAVDAA